jgi:hypothetical protein
MNFNQYFAGTHTRDRHSLNFDIFFAVQHGSRHLAIHNVLPSRTPGWITIFIESG